MPQEMGGAGTPAGQVTVAIADLEKAARLQNYSILWQGAIAHIYASFMVPWSNTKERKARLIMDSSSI